jgi:hypothetical protein
MGLMAKSSAPAATNQESKQFVCRQGRGGMLEQPTDAGKLIAASACHVRHARPMRHPDAIVGEA